MPEDERERSWWLILRDGTPVAGDAGGGVALLTALPGLRLPGRLLKALRMSRMVDTFDKLVARYRHRLSYIVPDGAAPRRYP